MPGDSKRRQTCNTETKHKNRSKEHNNSMTSSFYGNSSNTNTDRMTPGHQQRKIEGSGYYGEYHGHPVRDLEAILPALRESSDSLIWTAGDSSLDNKYWFHDPRPAVGAYQDLLRPPTMNADVTYWLNYLAREREQNQRAAGGTNKSRIATINTAVEATTVNERRRRLRVQDAFLRDNIRPEDTLVVSIGGNDVANAPMPCTILSMLALVKLPSGCLEPPVSCVCGSVPCNDTCHGCGLSSVASCCCAFPPCLGYMNHLFGTRIEHYIHKLVAKTKPKRVLVCMIYYLDETPTPSWAGTALRCLGYDSDPRRLQYLIRRMYFDATSKIQVESSPSSLSSNAATTIIPVPLFEVLDGKNPEDYVSRVEPSSQGGRKMAEYLLDVIERDETRLRQQQQQHPGMYEPSSATTGPASGPVESSYMLDRS